MRGAKKIPAAEPTIWNLVKPFQEFTTNESFGGILLFFATLVALVWANSSWAASYQALWHAPLTVSIGRLVASK